MKLNMIENYVKVNKLDAKYNLSFNKNRINSPKHSFHSSKAVNAFFKTGIGAESFDYLSYYNFLSKTIHPSRFANFVDFLSTLVDRWYYRDNAINKNDAIIYLLKQFVINPINGKIRENIILDSIKKRFNGFKIELPTKEQDENECWDIRVSSGAIKFCIQVKPISFFKTVKTISKASLLKIKIASFKYNNPIFLAKDYSGKTLICIRDKNNNGVKKPHRFIDLNRFKVEVLTQKQIFGLSAQTFFAIDNSNGFL